MPKEQKMDVNAGSPTDTVTIEPTPQDSGLEKVRVDEYRLRQQVALSEFGLEALRTTKFLDLLQKATELCARGMAVRLCKALRYDRERHELMMCAGVGWKPGIVGHATFGADLASPAGYALQTGEPVISNHLENEERFRTPEVMIDHGVRRAINVLITAHRQPWGVLEVDSPDEGKFQVEDIAFMQGFANLLGVAIERHDAEHRLQEALAHQRLLVQEASHRVKNSLAMVTSLLRLQARNGASAETASALGEAEARITTIAEAHDQLWRSSTVGEIEIREFLIDLCARLQEQSQTVTLECDVASLSMSAERAIATGLLVTELVTNAMKYAYPNGTGTVSVTLTADDVGFNLTVRDQGRGLPAGFDLKNAGRSSLGMRMIDSLSRQLRGRVEIDTVAGTTFNVTVPA